MSSASVEVQRIATLTTEKAFGGRPLRSYEIFSKSQSGEQGAMCSRSLLTRRASKREVHRYEATVKVRKIEPGDRTARV